MTKIKQQWAIEFLQGKKTTQNFKRDGSKMTFQDQEKMPIYKPKKHGLDY